MLSNLDILMFGLCGSYTSKGKSRGSSGIMASTTPTPGRSFGFIMGGGIAAVGEKASPVE
jgi:hypothetical protein